MFLVGGRSSDQIDCSDYGEIPSASVLVFQGSFVLPEKHEGRIRCALLKVVQTFGVMQT